MGVFNLFSFYVLVKFYCYIELCICFSLEIFDMHGYCFMSCYCSSYVGMLISRILVGECFGNGWGGIKWTR